METAQAKLVDLGTTFGVDVSDRDTTDVVVFRGTVQVFKDQPTRYLSFGARRRVDGLNKKTVTGKLQFREVPVAARVLEVEGVGKVKCLPLGQGNDAQDLPSKVGPTVWLGRDGARVGKLAGTRVDGVQAVDVAAAQAHLKQGPALLLVAEDAPLGAFLGGVGGGFQSGGEVRDK